MNPESADGAVLAACAEHGVTRISAGIQSLHDESRKAIGRRGSSRLVTERLGLLASRFPGRFSCDLISGLPLQTEAALLADINTVLNYGPVHISLYDLEAHGTVQSPFSVDDQAALWLAGRDLLYASGFNQYEVSNFSRGAVHRSRHNLRYWEMRNWLGLGPTASGTVIDDGTATGVRETDGRLERLDRDTLRSETLLMGFRTVDGPDRALWERRFGGPLEAALPRTLEKWRNYLTADKTKIALTPGGLLFLNRFLEDCFGELG